MDYSKYQQDAMRTAMMLSTRGALYNGAMGVASETGELLTTMKANLYYNKPIDRENIKEELGDILWFCAYMFDTMGQTMTDGGDFPPEVKIEDACLMLAGLAGSVSKGVFDGEGPRVISSRLEGVICLVAVITNYFGLTTDEVTEANITKLKKRYPDKYNNEAALARADKA